MRQTVRMPPATFAVDDAGLTLSGPVADAYDVYVDGRHVWSFSPEGRTRIRWPHAMKPFLDGSGEMAFQAGGTEVWSAKVSFGSGEGPLDFVDSSGIPVMIDKWGLIQRPFSSRDPRVLEEMLDASQQMIDVAEREVGVHPWIAFGTLLGAARSGKVIGHDSDVDLAYLSDKTSPAELNREMFALSRAFRRAGMRVVNKNGSFITVMIKPSDGRSAGVDLYSCFYISDLLHESATVRADVPREAIDPLRPIAFEGRDMPAPADVERLCEVSYGKGWRVPDPSFAHRPPPSTTKRFDGWFGSTMRNRRDWERWHRNTSPDVLEQTSDGAAWVAAHLQPGVHVVDLGAGKGADLLALARAGWSGTGVDYARGSMSPARALAKAEGLPVTFTAMNFYDRRDVLTCAASIAHKHPGPRAVIALGILDSVVPAERDGVYRAIRMLLGRGGRAHLEFAHDVSNWKGGPPQSGNRFALDPAEVARRFAELGAAVVEQGPGPSDAGLLTTRMIVEWPERVRAAIPEDAT